MRACWGLLGLLVGGWGLRRLLLLLWLLLVWLLWLLAVLLMLGWHSRAAWTHWWLQRRARWRVLAIHPATIRTRTAERLLRVLLGGGMKVLLLLRRWAELILLLRIRSARAGMRVLHVS